MTAADEDRPAASLFAGVVGQPAAVTALRAAARHPVHAYLFRGAPGTGSREAARAFAAALLCPSGGCGACDVCRQALAGTHPDLVVVERTGASLGVDDARRLVGLAQRRPFEADRQVLVVTDVHLATRSAPALLKTVEEPPQSTVFVLLADDLPPELVTVASRCVEVPFPPVPQAAAVAWLVARGTTTDRARLLAEGAGGDIDRARLLAEDTGFADRSALWRTVPSGLDGHGAAAGALARELLAAVDGALGPLRARHAEELAALATDAETLGDRGVPSSKEVADRQHREERRWRADELRAGLGMLARAYRQRMADLAASGAPDELRGYGEAVDLVTETAAALRRNPNETLLLESLLVRLGRLGG
ncbi:MAG: DNA polymerase III subunit delta' [Acidimicrobiales bacterium]